MKQGRPIPPLVITEQERQSLEITVHRQRATQSEVRRARVILFCASGYSNLEVSRRTGVCSHSVGQWRRCFLKGRLTALAGLRKQGPKRRIDDEKVTEIIRLTLESAPVQGTHWSTRALARRSGLSHASVARIWEDFGLKAHPQEGFQIFKDPSFVEKVRNVAGLYMSSSQNALVLCVGEKERNATSERHEHILPLIPARASRPTHCDYQHGTVALFAALAVQTGGVHTERNVQHAHHEFLDFLDELEDRIPEEFDIRIVLDNYATDRTMQVHKWLATHARWHIHLVPARSSWLYQVERFIEKLTESRDGRAPSCSVTELRAAMLGYINTASADAKPFRW